MTASNGEFQAYSHGLVVPPDQAVAGQKDCMDGNCYGVGLVGMIHGLAAVAAAAAVGILVGQDSAGGIAVVAHLIEQESIHVVPVALIAVEGAGTGGSGAAGQFDAEEIAAVETTAAGYVLNHGPAKQSGQHGQHERQDRHACSCRREHLQVVERLRIGSEEEH